MPGQPAPQHVRPFGDRKGARAPALEDARIEHGGLMARVRAHDQQRVGLVDSGDAGIEDVGRAAGLGIEGLAALDREIDRAAPCQQVLEREHLLDRGKISGDGADPLAVDAAGLRRDRLERIGP